MGCLTLLVHMSSLLQLSLRVPGQRLTWNKPLTSLTHCKAFSSAPFFFPAPSSPLPILPFTLGGCGKHFTLSTWAGSQNLYRIPGVPLWSFWCHKIFVGAGIGRLPLDIGSSYRDFTWTWSSCLTWRHRLSIRGGAPHFGMRDLLFTASLVR